MGMQVLYERCAGVDIGKDVIAVAVRLPGDGPDGRTTIKRMFETFYGVLRECAVADRPWRDACGDGGDRDLLDAGVSRAAGPRRVRAGAGVQRRAGEERARPQDRPVDRTIARS